MQGRVISNYKILRQIGSGGMGVVYLAQHEVIDRQVAIKLLRPRFAGNESLVIRFFNEARAAASAKHPGIVEILDVGHDEDQAFIMMEFIDGITLGKHLRQCKRLSSVKAIDFTRQIASALSAAHGCGVVHRDLKPSNVMLVQEGNSQRTKVFDFGIAKLFGEDSSHTRTGTLIGTPAYMSPEQCRGAGEIDARSDLYSLGCLLYRMLTGARVFDCEGEGEMIAQHLFTAPRPPIELASINQELNAVVLKLLEKKPEDRYQNTEELIAQLDIISASLTEEEEGEDLTRVFEPQHQHESPTPVSTERSRPSQSSIEVEDPAQGTPMASHGQVVSTLVTGRGATAGSWVALATVAVLIAVVVYWQTADSDSAEAKRAVQSDTAAATESPIPTADASPDAIVSSTTDAASDAATPLPDAPDTKGRKQWKHRKKKASEETPDSSTKEPKNVGTLNPFE